VVGSGRAAGMADVSRVVQTYLGYLLINGRFELGLGWFGDYDSYDLAALSLLSHGPPVRKIVRPMQDSLLMSAALSTAYLLRCPTRNGDLLAVDRYSDNLRPVPPPPSSFPSSLGVFLPTFSCYREQGDCDGLHNPDFHHHSRSDDL
jgi:hypothetical protein